MEQFRQEANLDVMHVPYNVAGLAVTAMLGGDTDVMFVTLASALSFIQAGRLKPIGISTARRVDALPRVPTMAESGFPDMVSGAWQGIFVPAGTPRPIVNKLHAAVLATLGSPETRQRLVDSGVLVVTSATPDEFTSFVGAEVARWGKVARESGATVD
jgi:tripartite-type tricarboxylate transporter receptor subunit TctC